MGNISSGLITGSDPLPALGQGMSDVATILARRVAVEFSDSDDCASESEYDSEDWGECLLLCLPSDILTLTCCRRD